MKTYRKIALIFTLLLTAATNLSAASQSEIDGLVALYDSTEGDNWNNNYNWKVGDPCSWYGVYCVDGDVTVLYLDNNNLRFSIPTKIGNLINLTYLNLRSNNLTGSIPSEIGLTNLDYLDLSFNSLMGSIPTEIGNLTNLTGLYLYSNKLTGSIPTTIGNLTNLIYLNLLDNHLTGSIPTEIGNLINLTQLNLYNNGLMGSIPTEIGKLTNLTYLYLNNNNLTGSIPTEIENLINLITLNLNSNYLSGEIPIEIQSLTTLTDNGGLNLFNNCSLDSNDTGTQSFIVLKTLSTSYEAFLLTQGHCSAAEEERAALVALYNSTDGDNWTNNRNWKDGYPCIDSWDGVWCDDGSVTGLVLGTNKLTGFIPAEIGNLTNLNFLDLSVNSLTGSIPAEIGLTKLNYLYLSFNSLTGFIPAEIGNLTNLTELKLSTNNLTGSIPSEIGDLTNLGVLFLSHNQLTGSIPTTIGDLTNLLYLYLNNNYLSGEIPSSIVHTALVDETSIGYGLTLEENCHLYSNDDLTKSFILSKTSYSTYDEFLSEQNHCIVDSLPFLIFLLLD